MCVAVVARTHSPHTVLDPALTRRTPGRYSRMGVELGLLPLQRASIARARQRTLETAGISVHTTVNTTSYDAQNFGSET